MDQAVETIQGFDEAASSEIVLLIVGADDVEFRDIMRLHDAASSISMQVAIE